MRVSVFLEQKNFSLRDWENSNCAIQKLVKVHNIIVSPNDNLNSAVITIQCLNRLTLKCKVLDIHQERPTMIKALKDSVETDITSNDFDYLDVIPPFGVVELYDIELLYDEVSTKLEIEALIQLSIIFLFEYFIMIVLSSKEVEEIQINLGNFIHLSQQFSFNEELYYRSKSY